MKKMFKPLLIILISIFVVGCDQDKTINIGDVSISESNSNYMRHSQQKVTPVNLEIELSNARDFAEYILKRRSDVVLTYEDSQITEQLVVNDIRLDEVLPNKYLISSFSLPGSYDVIIASELVLNEETKLYESTGIYHMCSSKNGDDCSLFRRNNEGSISGCDSCRHSMRVPN